MQLFKSAVIEAMNERDASIKEDTVSMSGVTDGKMRNILSKLNLSVEECSDDIPPTPEAVNFLAFDWEDKSEPEKTPDACIHLSKELTKFGCIFQRGGYKVVDIHTDDAFLKIHDKKIGNLSGGSDVAIVPFKTSKTGAIFQTCVLFEFEN